MPTYVWCELVCEECKESLAGQYTSASKVPRKDLVKEALAKGASTGADHIWCSRCAAANPFYKKASPSQGERP